MDIQNGLVFAIIYVMSQGTRLTQEEIEQIGRAYEDGLTLDEVSAKLGYGLSSINKYLRQLQIKRRIGGPPSVVLELSTDLEIGRRYAKGEPAHRIAADYCVSKAVIFQVVRSQGILVRSRSTCQQKHTCDHRFFQTIDTEAKAYWLGFFTADGGVGKPNIIMLYLALKDGDHVRRFAQAIQTSCPVREKMNTTYPVAGLSFRSTDMTVDLATHGIAPNKEQTANFPSLPDNLIRHYLRGLIDGDGSFSVSRGQLQLCIALSPTQAISIQSFLESEFEYPRVKIQRAGSERGISVLRYSGNGRLFDFCNWLYQDATVYLPRKRQRVLDHYQSLPKYRDQLLFG